MERLRVEQLQRARLHPDGTGSRCGSRLLVEDAYGDAVFTHVLAFCLAIFVSINRFIRSLLLVRKWKARWMSKKIDGQNMPDDVRHLAEIYESL